MSLLQPPNSDSERIAHVAIAIGIGNEVFPNQLHVGLLHRGTDGVGILHLCWHLVLKSNDLYDNSMWWVVPQIIPERLQSVAMLCRQLSRTAGASGIPYGFGTFRNVFDTRTGTFKQNEGAGGLTCATFVLGVFNAARLSLLDDETWPQPSQADLEWQVYIANTLKLFEKSAVQGGLTFSQIPAKRFQPNEVAAAAIEKSLPTTFQRIERSAKEIKLLVLGRYLHHLMEGEKNRNAVQVAEKILKGHGLVPNSVRVRQQSESVTLEYKNRYGLRSAMCLTLNSNPSDGIVRLIENKRLSIKADLSRLGEVIEIFDRGKSSQA